MLCENDEDFLKFCSFLPEPVQSTKGKRTKKIAKKRIIPPSDDEAETVLPNIQRENTNRKK